MTLIDVCTQAYSTWKWRGPARWVMDRPSYDRLRAEAVHEDQERARAREHANVMVRADA